MTVDPGKKKAGWRALFYVIAIYCVAFIYLRFADIIPERMPHKSESKYNICTFFLPLYLLQDRVHPAKSSRSSGSGEKH